MKYASQATAAVALVTRSMKNVKRRRTCLAAWVATSCNNGYI